MNKVEPGMKFGRLIILSYLYKDKKSHRLWNYVCACGGKGIVRESHLFDGSTKSCGCLNKENHIKHGQCHTSTYNTWVSMISRCENKNHEKYKNYGGRGILVCKGWHEFKNFYRDMGEKPDGNEIDRIDNNSGYLKENCRWVTHKENCKNKSTTRIFDYLGVKKTIPEWAKHFNINKSVFYRRYYSKKPLFSGFQLL